MRRLILPNHIFNWILLFAIAIILFLNISLVKAEDLDLKAAQVVVGKRFAKKFCEVKSNGISSEFASEFALNNTYLKFVAFPDDKKYIEDLWQSTIRQIREDCGDSLSIKEESDLHGFFEEEGEIASNRELYLPDS